MRAPFFIALMHRSAFLRLSEILILFGSFFGVHTALFLENPLIQLA